MIAGTVVSGTGAASVPETTAGVWLMDLVSTALYEKEGQAARQREQAARAALGGKDPASAVADQLARALGAPLTLVSDGQAATAIYDALGIVPGAMSGALRHRLPGSGPGCGIADGVGLFLVNDELLGLAAGPTAYPG